MLSLLVYLYPIYLPMPDQHPFNQLITGDNKGYASYLFEKSKNSNYRSKKQFVSAFAQGVEGDVTPNIFGYENGKNDFYRTQYIGQKQYEKANELFSSASKNVMGEIDYRIKYIDLSHYAIKPEFTDGHKRTTCRSAVGVAFTRGTADGKGVSLNEQLLKAVGVVLTQPRVEDIACHAPKQIFLSTANFKPYPWLPNVVPIQILKLGNIAILGVPGEFTTVAGEKLREAVKGILNDKVDTVIIAGLSNSYTGYITTYEEYLKQDYEGGFTVYGPWTLSAYLQAFSQLATALKQGDLIAKTGPKPLDLNDKQVSLQTGVIYDNVPWGVAFGDVFSGPNANAQFGAGQTINVTFWGGHPKNNFYRHDKSKQESFLFIQRKEHDKWVDAYDDHDWSTTYSWRRYGLDASHITITWDIPSDVKPGTYRIIHKGYYKHGGKNINNIIAYEGVSYQFIVKQLDLYL